MTYNTLMGMTKVELVDYIRCLEHNLFVTKEQVENQYKLLLNLYDEKAVYDWHNVLDDKDNLPPFYKDVIIAYRDKETKEYFGIDGEPYITVGHYGMAHPFPNVKEPMKIWNIFQYFDCNYEVVAWKYIEPYKKIEKLTE